MTQNWAEVLQEVERHEIVRDTLPRVRVVAGSPAVTVLEARLSDILAGEDWNTTSNPRLIDLVERYMVETGGDASIFAGKLVVYRPEEENGNIVIGPPAEFGDEFDGKVKGLKDISKQVRKVIEKPGPHDIKRVVLRPSNSSSAREVA